MLKKVLLCSFLFASVVFTTDLMPQVTTSVIPDLDGRIPSNSVQNRTQSSFLQRNPADFPIFPGFPILASYQTFSPRNGAIVLNMDSDPDMEIVYGTGDQLMAVNFDGKPVAGWPQLYAANWEATNVAASGDIDGDGIDEIVCANGGALGTKIYAYKKDGSVCPGFPIPTTLLGKYPVAPILSDIDGDGKMEIIMGTRLYTVVVYKGDGTMYPGWPKLMNKYTGSTCAAGDINNDGKKEIIAESGNRLYVWDKDGNIMPGFPFILPDTVNGSFSYSSPVLADLDKNGKRQIIFCSHASDSIKGGTIHVLNPDGTYYPGWPKYTNGSNWIYSPAVVADIDGDGELDIIVPDYAASTDPIGKLYGFKKNGTALAGFPKGPFYGSANQPTLVDLDGDGKLEIILDQNIQFGDYGEYIAVKLNDTNVPNWPLNVLKNTTFQQPVLTDYNKDGKLDFVGAGFEFSLPHAVYLYAFNTGLDYNPSRIVNPVFNYNNAHDGVCNVGSVIPVELAAFKADCSGNNVLVKWETATETNNAYFELLRNGAVIAKVDGKGTTSEKNSYSYSDKNLTAGNYNYKLIQHDFDGTTKEVGNLNVSVSAPVSFSLNQNYPNPFNPSTVISYTLAKDSRVKLNIFNTIGQKVKELVNRSENAGSHQVVFNASNLPSGIYTYSIEVISSEAGSNYFESKKMILAK